MLGADEVNARGRVGGCMAMHRAGMSPRAEMTHPQHPCYLAFGKFQCHHLGGSRHHRALGPPFVFLCAGT